MFAMRVLIRADGNKAIGMGHIAREAELALALGSCGFEVAFLTRSQEPALKKLNERGLNAVTIDERMNRTQEENAVLEEVKKYKPDLLVLDVFVQYENQFLLALKKHARITCCVLDQPEQMDIACDVVVNGNPVQMQYLYPNHYLVGPTYFMMAPLFLNLHKKRKVLRKSVKEVIITLGGSDHHDLIFKVLNALSSRIQSMAVTVVLGIAFGKEKELANFIAKKKIDVTIMQNVPSLAQLLFDSDIAITAGGNTLFERMAIGTPGMTANQLAVQESISSYFDSKKANVNAGMGQMVSEKQIALAFDRLLDVDLRKTISSNGKKLVDGNGIARIVKELKRRL